MGNTCMSQSSTQDAVMAVTTEKETNSKVPSSAGSGSNNNGHNTNNHQNGHYKKTSSGSSSSSPSSPPSGSNGSTQPPHAHAPPQRQQSNASAKSNQTSGTNTTAEQQSALVAPPPEQNPVPCVSAPVQDKALSPVQTPAPVTVQSPAAPVNFELEQRAPLQSSTSAPVLSTSAPLATAPDFQIPKIETETAATIISASENAVIDTEAAVLSVLNESTKEEAASAVPKSKGTKKTLKNSSRARAAAAMRASHTVNMCTTTCGMIDQYWKQPKLKQLTLLYWVQSTSCISDPEVERLRDAFAEHDPSEEGTILYADFQQAFSKMVELSSRRNLNASMNSTRKMKSSGSDCADEGERYHIRTIFDKLDCYQEGAINYIEFLAVRLNHQQQTSHCNAAKNAAPGKVRLSKKKKSVSTRKIELDAQEKEQQLQVLTDIFNSFDKDRVGTLSRSNLRQTLEEDWAITAMGGSDPDSDIDYLVEELFELGLDQTSRPSFRPKGGNDDITFDQFCKLFEPEADAEEEADADEQEEKNEDEKEEQIDEDTKPPAEDEKEEDTKPPAEEETDETPSAEEQKDETSLVEEEKDETFSAEEEIDETRPAEEQKDETPSAEETCLHTQNEALIQES